MRARCSLFVAFAVMAAVLVLPGVVSAQSSTSGAIAGTVTDATGGVLPGVTVEASSPVLIEGTRAVVTDAQGKYNIVNLKPGTYSVTFSLTGFSVVKRDGLALSAGFTAPISVELKVGSLQETVTVSGASPLVDVQNVRTQNVLGREKLDTLPSAQNMGSFAALTLGSSFASASGNNTDVGGTSGEQGTISIHNNRVADSKHMLDGMNTNNAMGSNGGVFHAGEHYNMEAFSEVTMAHNGMSADTETAGLQLNYVPKDGGNKFSGSGRAIYANENFQANNLTDALRARGASTPPTIRRARDFGGAIGGPIKKDTLWFFTAHRLWGEQTYAPGSFINKTPHTRFYTPDTSQRGYYESRSGQDGVRLTYQATRKDKVAFYIDRGHNCSCFQGVGTTTAPESSFHNVWDNNILTQLTWSRTQSNKLLFEGGYTWLNNPFGFPRIDGVMPNDIPITELSTGFTYNARPGGFFYNDVTGAGGGISPVRNVNGRASVSYVTGSHAFKAGTMLAHGFVTRNGAVNELPGFGPVSFQLLNGVPNRVTIYASPQDSRSDFRNMGFYAQDQWTLRKLTLNLGLRSDMFDGWSPAQDWPGGAFVQAFKVARVDGTPRWRDVSPRFGAAYDLTGNGRTAIKAAAGKYMAAQGAGISQANNPVLTIVSAATRTWNDANGNFYPDASELGPLSDPGFGTIRPATRYADDVLHANRPYTWQVSGSLERQLRDNMGLAVSYFRTAHFNQTATDNVLVTKADYDPFCVTVPSDARLPGGGGNQLCGQFNAQFGKLATSNLLTLDKNFGNETEVYNGMDVSLSSRFKGGATLQGGFSAGRTVLDRCFAIDSPQALYQCRVVTPVWAGNGQVKINGSIPVKFGIELSAVYQNIAGLPILANGVFTNAVVAPSLGRNLSTCAAPTGACTATVTVAMIQPNTVYEQRINLLDARVAKLFRGPFGRIRATLDVYNLFNNAGVQGRNNTFGGAWGTPTRIVAGRLFKMSAQLSF